MNARIASTFAALLTLTAVACGGCAEASGSVTSESSPAEAASAFPATPSASPTAVTGPSAAATSLRAADIALSLTAAGKLRLQVVTVDADGRLTPASLRLTVGRSTEPGTGKVVQTGAAAVHRVGLPGVTLPGRYYYYDVVLETVTESVRYPATGRYRFTAPASASQPLKMLVWGDSHPLSTALTAPIPVVFQQIVKRALARRPTLAVVSGDIVKITASDDEATVDARYIDFLAAENRLARRLPVLPAPGNHDQLAIQGGLNGWRRWFALPTRADPSGRFYSFTDGDVHVVVLASTGVDGNGHVRFYGPGDTRNSPQARWLVTDLRQSKARWTVVVLHHPLLDPKPTDPWAVNARTERDALIRLFAQNGVDLVLQGHFHSYRRHAQPVSKGGRTYRVAYVTQGTGGGPLYPVSTVPRDSYDKVAYSVNGYLMLRSSGSGKLTAVAYKVDPATGTETVGDSFTIQQIPRGAVYTP